MTKNASDIILNRLMSLHPKHIDLVLTRVWRLLDLLGNPELSLPPVIHIAGTNGKGSTQAMIRAGLEGDGCKVHAYTSPHLARFHERIRLAGELISESQLSLFLEECETANLGAPITYFEITTCAALLAMSRTAADYTLLEVGLGGRLDATNVIAKPELTIITPVSIDHTQFLGATIEKIAAEKAGIIKRGVPVIIGRQCEAALDVIEDIASQKGAPILAHNQHWRVWEERGRLIYEDEYGLRDLPLPNLIGAHQIENAGMALAALRYLEKTDKALEASVTCATWPARLQKLKSGPLVAQAGDAELWLDGGHNPAAGKALIEALSRLPRRPTYAICGMLNTKDIGGYLKYIGESVEGLYGVSIPDETASLTGAETVEAAREQSIEAIEALTVEEAISAITKQSPNARILICGSLYLAGYILRQNG